MTDLRDLNDDDGLARYYASSWLETCRTTFDLLEETLSLYDVVLKVVVMLLMKLSIHSSSQKT
jgi:hypothetical protein